MEGVLGDHIVISNSTGREIIPNPRVREINNPRGSSKFHKILEFFKDMFLMNINQLFKHGVSLLPSAAREAQSGTDEISCEGSSSTSTERAQMNKAVIIVEIYFEPAIKEVLSIASRFQGVMSIHMEIKDEKLVLTVIGDFDVISMGAELSLLWVTELVSFGPA
ncbi:hypothetical protein Q3G72_028076 [Acer saccharum]|nr:hypothetical protein Q3G72_028076 [Acer saccharum]